MLLNLFAFLIIPGYTLLYVKNFNLFTVNFSVIGNLLGKKRAFVIWGFLTGIYFYFVLSSVSKNLRLSKRVRYLVHTALMLLFLAVFTPYLPQEFPFKAFLHIVFAMAASLWFICFLPPDAFLRLTGQQESVRCGGSWGFFPYPPFFLSRWELSAVPWKFSSLFQPYF